MARVREGGKLGLAMASQALEENRRAVRRIADAVAPGWERWRTYIENTTTPVREWMLRALAPRPGQTLLELGAGPGDTGFDAVALTGDDGHLICSDISPAMLAVARRRCAERGVGNVDYRLLDIEAIELGDDCVDGVLCRYAAERNPFFSVLGMTLVRHGHLPPPDASAPGPFSLDDAVHVRRLLEQAGFADVRVEEIAVRFRDIGECVAMATDTSGPMAIALQGLAETERAAVAQALEATFVPFRAGAGYEVPGVTVVAVAA